VKRTSEEEALSFLLSSLFASLAEATALDTIRTTAAMIPTMSAPMANDASDNVERSPVLSTWSRLRSFSLKKNADVAEVLELYRREKGVTKSVSKRSKDNLGGTPIFHSNLSRQ
jgi:hypothetical protein